jgi:hypothetical protein
VKKVLRISLISFLALVILAIAGLHISYHSFSPTDKGILVDEPNLAYFQESYDEVRGSFSAIAMDVAAKYDHAETFSVKVPGKKDDDLMMDFLYLPPLDSAGKLLVLSSGIHGVEGFAGSAVQQMFLEELISDEVLSEMGILMIHGLNPFGLKHIRRTTENNVDLNRGSDIDPSLFQRENPGYATLYEMLNPEGKVSMCSLRNQFFYLIAIGKLLKESMAVLRQAVLLGQYDYPEGIYFGGQDFEPQIDSLRRILPGYFAPYETILAIDLHTGYGTRRTLHLFPNPVDDPLIRKTTEAVFEGQFIDWGDSEDFYVISGSFAESFLSGINPEAFYLYMVFEWGTKDSQKTFGSLKSLQSIINENQGFHHGYRNRKQEEKVINSTLELYYPESEAWRSEVIESGRDMLALVLSTYPGINSSQHEH